jgi:hypothetical protein
MKKERETANKYRQQALEGDLMAMNNIGVCYAQGIGVFGYETSGQHRLVQKTILKTFKYETNLFFNGRFLCWYEPDGTISNQFLST